MIRECTFVLFSDTVGKLHHYTSEDGWLGIRADRAIRMSQDTTAVAVLGTGVYLNSLPPLTDTGQILWKNWDGQAPWTTAENIQCCIMLDKKISQVLRNRKIDVTSGW
jgi:hypothetical protein